MTDREARWARVEHIRVRIMQEAYDLADRDDSEGYNSVKVMCSDVLAMINKLLDECQPEHEPIAWVYPEALEALKSGRPWTAYGSNGEGRIPLYLNDAVAPRVEPRFGGSGAGFESLPASPHKMTEKNT